MSSPESDRHDATQKPAHFDAAEREREALRRIEQWYGIGEWQAAMLALAIDPRARDAAARWHAFEAATADLHVAGAVREQVQALGAGTRRLMLQMLLDRARQSPALHQQRLRREWSKRQRHPVLASADTAADQWRALVIRRALAPPSNAVARGTLATHADALRAASRCMARVLTTDTTAQAQWHDAALAALESMGLPPPRGPGIGLAPPTVRFDQRELLAALRVRRLSAMQRPLLLRAWLDAAQSGGLLNEAGVADALHLVCVALDAPVPQALQS